MSAADGYAEKNNNNLNMNDNMNSTFNERIRTELDGIERKHKVLREKIRESANDRSLGAPLTMKTIPNCLKRIMATSTFISECKDDLKGIKDKLGSDDFYVKLSTEIAMESIDVVIDAVNNAIGALSQKPNPEILQGVASYALPVMEMIGTYDIDEEYLAFYEANLSSLQRLNERLTKTNQQAKEEKTVTTSDQKEESEGCYIATMVYGDYDHPQVKALRDFRDTYLAKRNWGKRFIDYYYHHSPEWAERLKNHKAINSAIRFVLDGFIISWKKQSS